ncbi:dihydrodipicolinate synthase family protein [Brachybacterium paraconglomeratum]|uniref:dihydrodipicolinate synthase family protein n=1 Tax=Brachybacterium paraconglomeratum TaxID=173362 RepID=UPI0021A941CD|nr:dihydrodipicolinate synthase family protein [Brachybacterium paraconglomeratum]MCT1908656.1 dihydrodipicolinate synthase family protein [Brachybacterium paraconglomeratum]
MSDLQLTLLGEDGALRRIPLAEAPAFARPTAPLRSRVVYAAVHVVPLVHGDNTPGAPARIDWDATLAFRRTMWSRGLGVADAMDTAQRGMGLDPAATRELITRTADAAREALEDPEISAVFPADATVSDLVVAGVNTDQRTEQELSLDEIVEAYVEQLRATERAGAGAVLMASRHLARTARSAADYEEVYRRVLAEATAPVVLHWLGTVFDPQLKGYFGSDDPAVGADTLLRIIEEDPSRIRGVKMSLLDDAAEIAVRERLPEGVRMLTGDDFHFSHLIVGDGTVTTGADEQQVRGEYSDALLGAFAATAPAASAAVQALDRGDVDEARRILDAAEQLGRHVFSAPTYHYKTGVAFLAWLNGHQQAFTMVGGMHSARSLPHLSRTIELAATTGNLEDPVLAAERWHGMLRLAGYEIDSATDSAADSGGATAASEDAAASRTARTGDAA